jgi:hypothetical protein
MTGAVRGAVIQTKTKLKDEYAELLSSERGRNFPAIRSVLLLAELSGVIKPFVVRQAHHERLD